MKNVTLAYLLAVALLLGTIAVGLSLGETFVSPLKWLPLLISPNDDSVLSTIFLQLRWPRVLSAALVGSCLACAGAAFQGLFRNALADPYVIGASSGAALGVAVAIVMGLQGGLGALGATAAMAMAGALLVVGVVLTLANLIPHSQTATLLLAGIAVSSLVHSLVSALMILNDQRAVAVLSWIMGSLASAHWGSLSVAACIGIPCMLALCLMARGLDAFSLGDTTAGSLGLDVPKFRVAVIVVASLATAAAVSLSGIIGFVGLVAPHIARQFVGSRHSIMMPLSAGFGAALMILADAVSRFIIAPAELPVGIVTAMIGSPFFLWLLLAKRSDHCYRD